MRKLNRKVHWKYSITLQRIFMMFSIAMSFTLPTSCYYDPDDDYIIDRKRPASAPEVLIELNIDSDTVYFTENIPVLLKLKPLDNNVIVKSIKLFVDDEPVEYTTNNQVVVINPFELDRGIHKFRIEYITTSGSGSIGDILGEELFQTITRELIFIVRSQETTDWIQENYSEEGLVIRWNPGLVFPTYEIRKEPSIYYANGGYLMDTVFTTRTNEFIDTRYIGECAYYKIYGVSEDNQKFLMARYKCKFRLPDIEIIDNNGLPAIHWPKPPHLENIIRFELVDHSNSNSPMVIATIPSTDTLYTLDASYFGVTPRWSLRYVPNQTIKPESLKCFETRIYEKQIELPGPKLQYITGSTCSEVFYRFDDTLYRYSAETFKISDIQEVKYSLAISPDGNYLLYQLNQKIILQTLDHGSTVSSYQYNGSSHNYSVSNNGIGAFNSQNGLIIHDFISNNIHINNHKYSYAARNLLAEISPNGKYIRFYKSSSYNSLAKTIIAKIENGNIIPLDSIDGVVLNFHETDPSLLYYHDGYQLNIAKTNDLLVTNTIPTGDSHLGNIDFCTNRMATYNYNYYYIYDLESGSLLYTFPKGNNYSCFLIKNVLILNFGNRIILPD